MAQATVHRWGLKLQVYFHAGFSCFRVNHKRKAIKHWLCGRCHQICRTNVHVIIISRQQDGEMLKNSQGIWLLAFVHGQYLPWKGCRFHAQSFFYGWLHEQVCIACLSFRTIFWWLERWNLVASELKVKDVVQSLFCFNCYTSVRTVNQ